MRYGAVSMIKAISTLAVGVAFFLAGCQPKPLPKAPPPEPVSQEIFIDAEKYYHAGQMDQAQEKYRLLVKKLDKVASTSTIHKNTASRIKSRMARRLNTMKVKAAG